MAVLLVLPMLPLPDSAQIIAQRPVHATTCVIRLRIVRYGLGQLAAT
jgi:hypothetical protein